jgi:hypothetical protein
MLSQLGTCLDKGWQVRIQLSGLLEDFGSCIRCLGLCEGWTIFGSSFDRVPEVEEGRGKEGKEEGSVKSFAIEGVEKKKKMMMRKKEKERKEGTYCPSLLQSMTGRSRKSR